MSVGQTDMYFIGDGDWIKEQIEGSVKQATVTALHNIVSRLSLDQCTNELAAAGRDSMFTDVQEARDAVVAMAMEGWQDGTDGEL